MKPLRYVHYGRVSSLKQKEDETIEMQKTALASYAKAHHLTVVGEYYDEAQSGTLPFEKRPAGRQLLADAQLGKFDAVLFYRTDRLGRSSYEGLRTCKMLNDRHVSIRSISESYDTSTPEGKMMFTLLLAFAERELTTIKSRMTEGKQRKLKAGKYVVGHAPYGYLIQDQHLVLDMRRIPGTTYTRPDVIQLIFQKTAYEGYGQIKLAMHLDALGIPAPNDKPHWALSDINRFLQNTKYKGEMIVNQHSDTFEPFTISVPPIISPQLYDDARRASKHRRSYHKRTGREYLLNNGILRCGYCGQSYSGFSQKKGQFVGYRCVGRVSRVSYYNNRKKCTKGSQVAADIVESMIWNTCKQYLEHPESVEAKLREQFVKSQELCLAPDITVQTKQLQKRQQELQAERKRMVENLIKARITEEEFDAMAAINKTAQEEVTNQIHTLADQTDTRVDVEASIMKAKAFYENLAKQLPQSNTFSVRQKLVHTMLDTAVITTANHNITIDIRLDTSHFLVNSKNTQLTEHF